MKIHGIRKIQDVVRDIHATESEFRRYIWQRWHNRKGSADPLFLVGCGRSGTSMIVRHLNRSWRTKLYNEDNPAAFTKWRLRDLSVVESLVNQSSAQITIFKPILDTHRTDILLSRFPTAKVLFVFRHYNDVINSSLKRFGTTNRINHVRSWVDDNFGEFTMVQPPNETKEFIRSRWKPSLSPESGAALYWLFYNRLFFDLHLDQDQRVKLVQYESVVAEPVPEFHSICGFIGLPCEPQIPQGIYSSSINRNSPPDLDPQIKSACEDLWHRLCQQVRDNHS